MPRLLAPVLLAALLVPASATAQTYAAIFDGYADYIDFGVFDPGAEFTAEAWVQFNSVTDWNTVFEVVQLGTGINAFYLGYNLGDWEFELADTTVWEGDSCGVTALCFTSPVSPLTPHHVAVTRDASEGRFYINGNLIITWPTPPDPGFGTQNWTIGADTDNGLDFTSDPLDGYMAEVRVWDTARTQGEILTTMNYGLTGMEAGLVALWDLDHPPGTPTADDLGPNGYDGVLMGDTDYAPTPFWTLQSQGGDIPGLDFDQDGYTPLDGDCDDADPTVNPVGVEACDLVDSNCDGDLVDGFPNVDGDDLPDCVDADNDNDGDPDLTDCEPLDPTIYNGAPESCDLVDSNCDGELVDGFPNADGDGLPDCVDDDVDGDGDPDATDCAPDDPAIYNGAPEDCDAIDSDCDGDLVDGYDDTDADGDHPTQTLADALWLHEYFPEGIAGKKIAVSWAYSPSYAKPLSVPQGLITLMTRFGAHVSLAHPPGYRLMEQTIATAEQHAGAGDGSFTIVDNMDAAFEGADVVYPKSWGPYDLMLERVAANKAGDKAELAAIEQRCLGRNADFTDWICDERRMALTNGGDALYMHCLPADIGDEVSPGVMSKHTVNVAREANWKVYVIMAMLAIGKVEDLGTKLDAL